LKLSFVAVCKWNNLRGSKERRSRIGEK